MTVKDFIDFIHFIDFGKKSAASWVIQFWILRILFYSDITSFMALN